MTVKAHIDFETRSTCDLRKAGVYVYAEDAGTEVLCMAWCLGDAPVQVWEPADGLAPLAPLFAHIRAGGRVGAHNAAFEERIWNTIMVRDGAPPLPFDQLDCTMVRALVMSLPGAMETLAMVLNIGIQKDMTGNRLMLQMSKPKPAAAKKGVLAWFDDPDRRARLKAYCLQDVEVERAVDKKLPPLTEAARALWLIDQRINARGVLFDQGALARAQRVVDEATALCDAEMLEVTGGAVPAVSARPKLLAWLNARGCYTAGTAKAQVAELLAGTLPDDVRRALELVQEAGKASTKKLVAMRAASGSDGRARGALQFHGAHTGRWSGRIWQPHNFLRAKLKPAEIACAFDTLMGPNPREMLDMLFGPPVDVLGSCMRGMLIPAAGHEFIGSDLSNIEGRTLAWLAGETWKLEAFRAYDRKMGPDLYKLAYAKAFARDVDTIEDDERQIGKVMELALGYGGGAGAFASMAKNYGITVLDPGMAKPAGAANVLTHDEVEAIKWGWREAHPETVTFWSDLEGCAMSAIRQPGNLYKTRNGKIKFMRLKHFLLCQLPSGRTIAYFGAFIGTKRNPWTGVDGPALKYYAALGKNWVICDTYGGALSENVTQAVAADVLIGGIVRCEAAGMPVVLHVHDEIVTECPVGLWGPDDLVRIMTTPEKWADGLPVTSKPWTGNRYQK